MTGTSLLQPHPLGLYTSSGLCVLLLLLVVKGEYWKMRATGWKVPRDSLRRKALPLRCRAVQKGHDFHPAGFLRTSGAPTWQFPHKHEVSGCCPGLSPQVQAQGLEGNAKSGSGPAVCKQMESFDPLPDTGTPGKVTERLD